MSLLRDILIALALVISAFAYYEAKIKPIYICDIQGLVKEYISILNKENIKYEEKEKRLEDFMYSLRQVLNEYGTVYKKGTVTGKRVVDITPDVRTRLFGVSRYK